MAREEVMRTHGEAMDGEWGDAGMDEWELRLGELEMLGGGMGEGGLGQGGL